MFEAECAVWIFSECRNGKPFDNYAPCSATYPASIGVDKHRFYKGHPLHPKAIAWNMGRTKQPPDSGCKLRHIQCLDLNQKMKENHTSGVSRVKSFVNLQHNSGEDNAFLMITKFITFWIWWRLVLLRQLPCNCPMATKDMEQNSTNQLTTPLNYSHGNIEPAFVLSVHHFTQTSWLRMKAMKVVAAAWLKLLPAMRRIDG